MSTVPPNRASSLPLSVPIGSLIAGAALSAIAAIQPYTTGQSIDWPLVASIFIVAFGSVFAGSAYHVQVSSPVQQQAEATLAPLLSAVLNHLAQPHPAPTIIVHPATTPTATVAVEHPAVSTDIATAVLSTDIPTHV